MERQSNMQGGRIQWIDLAKGAVIFLVIIGHTVNRDTYGNLVRAAIFSFHMPFYFILSSMTFRFSRDMDAFRRNTVRAAKHLLMPVAAIVAVMIVWSIILDPSLLTSPGFWHEKLYTVVLGSGINQTYGDIDVYRLGMPWFFLALFFGRTVFDYLQLHFEKRQLIVVCWIVSSVGVLFKSFTYLPLSLDIAMACMPFFHAGHALKGYDFNKKPIVRALGWALVWAFTLWLAYPRLDKWTYLELACRRYPLYPLCFLTAFAGTMAVCHVSAVTVKLGAVLKPLLYVGRNSIYLLIVHSVDEFCYALWAEPNRQFVEAGKRVLVDLAMFAALMIVMTAWRAIRRKPEEKR